jgi:hypothetical protein
MSRRGDRQLESVAEQADGPRRHLGALLVIGQHASGAQRNEILVDRLAVLLAKAGVAQHTRSLKRPAQVVSLLDRDYRTPLLIMRPITA